MTLEEIEAGRSEKGGFTRTQLAAWGVPWPAPSGWKTALMEGRDPVTASLGGLEESLIRKNVSAHDLLTKVVLAVVEAGHASDLYKFPDVLEYFGAQMPEKQ